MRSLDISGGASSGGRGEQLGYAGAGEASAAAWARTAASLEALGDPALMPYAFAASNPLLLAEAGADTEGAGEAFDRLFARGNEAFAVGDIRAAVEAFEAALQVSQREGAATGTTGTAAAGDMAADDAAAERATACAECWRMLGLSHAEHDEDRKAITCLERTVAEDPCVQLHVVFLFFFFLQTSSIVQIKTPGETSTRPLLVTVLAAWCTGLQLMRITDAPARRALGQRPNDGRYHLDALLALGVSYVNELDSARALRSLRAWVTHNPRYHGLEVDPQDA